jgi:serine/threonine protein kinase
MSNKCPICGTPLATGEVCPKHSDNAKTIVSSGSEDEGQGDNLSTVLDSSNYNSKKAGDYVLIEKLGEGGMGEVWLAVHPTIQKKVAIKILHAKFVSNQQVLSRFMREAKAVNQISHENLVDIFSFGELDDKRPFFAMEFLQGLSLTDYLRKKRILPYGEILIILDQVCRALDSAHESGVIHRDLKPDNLHIITQENGQPFVKILDFGIAKLTDTPEAQALTRTGMIFGTPAYMSPEQCEGAKKVDARSDQYSVATILYEMLTGKNPFKEKGDSVAVILKKQIVLDPPIPSQFAKGRHFPGGIDRVILKALSKNPAQRYPSCVAFYEAFAKAIDDNEPIAEEEPMVLTNEQPEAKTTLDKTALDKPAFDQKFQATTKLPKANIQPPPEAPEPPAKPSNARTLLIMFLIAAVLGGGVGLFIVSQLAK